MGTNNSKNITDQYCLLEDSNDEAFERFSQNAHLQDSPDSGTCDLQHLRHIRLSVAIIGQSGVGKTTLLSKLFVWTDADRNTTTELPNTCGLEANRNAEKLEYTNQGFPNLTIWDVPGFLTRLPNMPKTVKNYWQKYKLDEADIYIFMSKQAMFYKEDADLYLMCKSSGKPVFWVSSYFDNDLRDYCQNVFGNRELEKYFKCSRMRTGTDDDAEEHTKIFDPLFSNFHNERATNNLEPQSQHEFIQFHLDKCAESLSQDICHRFPIMRRATRYFIDNSYPQHFDFGLLNTDLNQCVLQRRVKINAQRMVNPSTLLSGIQQRVGEIDASNFCITNELDGIKSYLDNLSNIPMSIALIGLSGVGKTVFLTKCFVWADDDPHRPRELPSAGGLASNRTIEIKEYKNSDFPNLTIWDVPGFLTRLPNMPNTVKNYWQNYKLDEVDIYIFMSKQAMFYKEDADLFEMCKNTEKPVFWVSSYFDNDLRDYCQNVLGNRELEKYFKCRRKRTGADDDAEEHTEIVDPLFNNFHRGRVTNNNEPQSQHEFIQFHLDKCAEHLSQDICDRFPIMRGVTLYYVDNSYPQHFDFELLKSDLINRNGILFEKLANCLFPASEAGIKLKAKKLKKRVFLLCSTSAASGSIPIPFINLAVDIPFYIRMIQYFRKVFGLDIERRKWISKTYGISENEINSVMKFANLDFKKETIVQGLKALVSSGASIAAGLIASSVDEFFKLVPIVGSAVGAAVGYAASCFILYRIVHKLEQDAIAVVRLIIKHERVKLKTTSLVLSAEDIALEPSATCM